MGPTIKITTQKILINRVASATKDATPSSVSIVFSVFLDNIAIEL